MSSGGCPCHDPGRAIRSVRRVQVRADHTVREYRYSRTRRWHLHQQRDLRFARKAGRQLERLASAPTAGRHGDDCCPRRRPRSGREYGFRFCGTSAPWGLGPPTWSLGAQAEVHLLDPDGPSSAPATPRRSCSAPAPNVGTCSRRGPNCTAGHQGRDRARGARGEGAVVDRRDHARVRGPGGGDPPSHVVDTERRSAATRAGGRARPGRVVGHRRRSGPARRSRGGPLPE